MARPIPILAVAACLVVGWGTPSPADQFEQIDGPVLMKLIQAGDAQIVPHLTIAQIAAMPNRLADSRSALVIARTDRGNPARLLLVVELRKPANAGDEPFPVLVVERLDSFDAAGPATRVASRRDIVLYDGFQLDLDTGQVVPEGQGGDIIFRNADAGAGTNYRLESRVGSTLFALAKPFRLDSSKGPQPTPGRAVVAADFAGRYRLYANGQWSGTLDLAVEGRGVVVGRFRSDLHGSSYPVTGQVATDTPQRVRFAIAFPRARQELDGYLFGDGKGAMAGTASLLERTSGFFAIREGGRYAPEGAEIGATADPDRPTARVLTLARDGSATIDGKATAPADFAAALGAPADPDSPPSVLIRADPETPFRDLRRVVGAIEAAGVRVIRFDPEAAPK